MDCRIGCGACCIAPSISSPIPGMEGGKKAGERCIQLDENNLCLLFGKKERPQVCVAFQADFLFCGCNSQDALQRIDAWEIMTKIS